MTNDEIQPRTESGRALQRAEALARKLDETGDTPRSFLIKGAVGCLGLAVLAGLCIWGLVALVRLILL